MNRIFTSTNVDCIRYASVMVLVIGVWVKKYKNSNKRDDIVARVITTISLSVIQIIIILTYYRCMYSTMPSSWPKESKQLFFPNESNSLPAICHYQTKLMTVICLQMINATTFQIYTHLIKYHKFYQHVLCNSCSLDNASVVLRNRNTGLGAIYLGF